MRARALSALVSGIVASAANIFWGWFYDLKYFSRPQLAKITWAFLSIGMLALISWQTANEQKYANTTPKPTLDWALPGFGRGFASMVLMRYVNTLKDNANP